MSNIFLANEAIRTLSTGVSLITRLAVGLVLYSTPVTLGVSGLSGQIVNAGFAALCGDAAVSLVENGGDPGRAMKALAKNGTAMNVARSMATAGLVHGIGDLAGLSPKNVEFLDYAKKAAVNAAVNAAMSVAIDRQDFKKAMLQEMTTAAINSVASWGAGQIGDAYRLNTIDPVVHKLLHTALGGASGAAAAALWGDDIKLAALSGATGALIAETVADILKPDVQTEMQEAAGKKLDRDEFEQKLIEKAQISANWGNFAAAVGAFGAGLDVGVAYGAAQNATEHNFLQAALVIASLAGTAYEGYQIYQTYKKDGGEAAMNHLGISVVEGAVVAGVAGVAFKVGKTVYPSLKEAFKAAVANNTILKTSLTTLETKLGTIEQAIRTKFNTGGIEAFKSAPNAEKSVRFAQDSTKKLANEGRAGKQQKLREMLSDDKLGSADRGWIQQELNAIERGKRKSIRNPIEKDLAHRRGFEASKGFDYRYSQLQGRDLHRLQHKYDGNGIKNKTPSYDPLNLEGKK